MIKFRIAGLLCCILFFGCNNNHKSSNEIFSSEIAADTISSEVPAELKSNEPIAFLAITSHALQVIDATTGSTTELTIGMEMEKLTEILKRVLPFELPKPQVNSECGAGPMTILTLENGLIIMSQSSGKDPGKMDFVGWSLSQSDQPSRKITTLSGIGIGSTREELENVYMVEINNTSLGNEFSIGNTMFGILNSRDQIEFLWSGLSCNFR